MQKRLRITVYETTENGTEFVIGVTYKGERYGIHNVYNENWEWNQQAKSGTIRANFAALVPAGYDGYLFGPWDSTLNAPEGGNLFGIADENWLFFRME